MSTPVLLQKRGDFLRDDLDPVLWEGCRQCAHALHNFTTLRSSQGVICCFRRIDLVRHHVSDFRNIRSGNVRETHDIAKSDQGTINRF